MRMTHDILDTVAATNDDYESATNLPVGVDQEWWVWHLFVGSHFCKSVKSSFPPAVWVVALSHHQPTTDTVKCPSLLQSDTLPLHSKNIPSSYKLELDKKKKKKILVIRCTKGQEVKVLPDIKIPMLVIICV